MSDPLSDFLARSPVDGSVFCRAELAAPWSVATSGGDKAIFHVVLTGSGILRVSTADGEVVVPWRQGDVVLVVRGDPHVMCSDVTVRPVPIRTLPSEMGDDGLPCLTTGGEGAVTSILCGTFHFRDDARTHLLPHVPPVLHLRGSDDPTAAWVDATLRLLGAEAASGLPGADAVVSRLADVVLVQALRAWVRDCGPQEAGWLGALADPQLARVLGAIHDAPAKPWTAALLARTAGMSRSLLFERFGRVVGESPLSYLTKWRMLLARQALRDNGSISAVAEVVGYRSEAAFSRAFKRHVGVSPSCWRREERVA